MIGSTGFKGISTIRNPYSLAHAQSRSLRILVLAQCVPAWRCVSITSLQQHRTEKRAGNSLRPRLHRDQAGRLIGVAVIKLADVNQPAALFLTQGEVAQHAPVPKAGVFAKPPAVG